MGLYSFDPWLIVLVLFWLCWDMRPPSYQGTGGLSEAGHREASRVIMRAARKEAGHADLGAGGRMALDVGLFQRVRQASGSMLRQRFNGGQYGSMRAPEVFRLVVTDMGSGRAGGDRELVWLSDRVPVAAPICLNARGGPAALGVAPRSDFGCRARCWRCTDGSC